MDNVERARRPRAEYANAIRYARGLRTLLPPTQGPLRTYHSRGLRRQANAATRLSGYGAIRDERGRIVQMLSPAAFEGAL